MKKKIVAAALGILVVAPSSLLAQDRSDQLSSVAVGHLPALKTQSAPNRDSNTNGTIIGAAIGGVAGALLGAGLASIDEGSDAAAGSILLMAVLGAGGGAGIGYAVDNAHHQVAYRIPVSKHISVQPHVGLDTRPVHAAGARAGVNAAFGW